MKVVLFCGGQGMRLRGTGEGVPKPMVPIGARPIMWHLMKYYAHYGVKDFIVCLGWNGAAIKDYFLNYNETATNDFVLEQGNKVRLLSSDIHDWTITFVDTGLTACVGERLMAVRHLVENDELFFANYADGLSDVSVTAMVDFHRARGAVATCLGAPPPQTFHLVDAELDGTVTCITAIRDSGLWTNAGFYVLSPEIFDYMEPGEELVAAPFQRLCQRSALAVYRHTGFWACMDTFKEKQMLDELSASGSPPWAVWMQGAPTSNSSRPNPSALRVEGAQAD